MTEEPIEEVARMLGGTILKDHFGPSRDGVVFDGLGIISDHAARTVLKGLRTPDAPIILEAKAQVLEEFARIGAASDGGIDTACYQALMNTAVSLRAQAKGE